MRFSALALVAALLGSSLANAQSSRRERQDPELIVEIGGRLAYCDQMLFTADGKWVLTVGDDKVVRMWACVDGKLDPASMRVLRWNIWREFRGAMYALAVSPDKEGRYVAVGGIGETNTTVAVLDRTTGDVVHYGPAVMDLGTGEMVPQGAPLKGRKLRNYFSVMSVAFAPSGKRLAFGTAEGSVFLWDFTTIRPLGQHDPNLGKTTEGVPVLSNGFNRVRLARFLSEDRLLTVSENGEVVEWDLTARPGRRVSAWVIGHGNSVRVAAANPMNHLLAFGLKSSVIAIRTRDGSASLDVTLEERAFPRSVTFDATGKRLAVGIGTVPADSKFFMETDDQVRVYDVTGAEAKEEKRLAHTGRAESLAFHPDGGLLAVAGGNNHEVSLYDLAKGGAPVSVMRGAGTCLWDVGLSPDNNVLAFKDQRNSASRDPNDRGQGPWRAFDLPRRRWVAGDTVKPVERLEQIPGWQVRATSNLYIWEVVHGEKRFKLEYDGDREGVPRCWTFIEADGDNPARLAVGHYWGLSVYELSEDGPKRVRLCVGHQGEAIALGLSRDRTWLVSCSNDQTIAAWSLSNKWPSQAILGAAFEPRGDVLHVTAVDTGSPAWEAGLVVGDDIVLFAFDTKLVPGGPEAWHARLKEPVPGKEHYFGIIRDRKPIELLTTARQRPIWRFLPTRDGEWVLWMWRNSFYDTSTRGDFAIGWHVNSLEPGKTPHFYRAEQFRKIFQKRTVIDKLLQTRDVRAALKLLGDNPLPARFDETEPPAVALTVAPVDGGWEAVLTATPHGDNPDLMPREGELWVNGFRMEKWANVGLWQKDGRKYTIKVPVPAEALRAGDNELTFQTFNRLGGRAEVSATVTTKRQLPARPRLFGLAVGINDYKSTTPPRGQRNIGDLVSAVGDAEAMKKAWQTKKAFSSTDLTLLTDAGADRDAIERALDALARRAQPDDLCVIFLAGHGMFHEEDTPDAKRSLFVFCASHFNGQKPEATGVTSEVLYEKLARINCRKLVLLDACHSGEAASNPVRGLTPGGQGPVIIAACDRNQHSYENPKYGHGLFTYAVLEALGDKFDKADANGDHQLDTRELYDYTRARLPQMLTEIKQNEFLQVPILFAPQEKPFAVMRRE